ncbi:hypothetical protein XENTR_v10003889 [Xenopus tropicalis]|nr:hypothetical protein XENTR_v10003889 [Xenopus tropicalis]
MALETQILKSKGFSDAVVHTMRAARKPVSSKSYHRVWSIYHQWCDRRGVDFETFSIPTILEFLQDGLSMGLSLSSLKSQISALSVLFQDRLALLPDVKTFLQGVSHLSPPYRAPTANWDLTLVLRALQHQPFEPLASIPLQWLTWKTVLLLALASARRVSELSALSCKVPFLVFHHDRAVLRTVPTQGCILLPSKPGDSCTYLLPSSIQSQGSSPSLPESGESPQILSAQSSRHSKIGLPAGLTFWSAPRHLSIKICNIPLDKTSNPMSLYSTEHGAPLRPKGTAVQSSHLDFGPLFHQIQSFRHLCGI